MSKKYNISIIEGPLAKQVRQNAHKYVVQIIKRHIDEIGEAEFKQKVANQ